MKEAKKTVAFRLEPELLKLLTAKAKELEISPGAYARILVTEELLADSCLLEELREMARTFVAFASSRGSKPWVGSFFRLADELREAADRAFAEPRP